MSRSSFNAQILYIGRVKPQRHWTFARHVHSDSHELIVILSGSLEASFPDETSVAQIGEAFHYRAGRPHAERAVTNQILETIYIGWRAPRFDTTRWPTKVTDRAGRLATIARWLLEQSPRADGAAMKQHLLAVLLHEFEACGQNLPVGAISLVQRYVHSHLAEPIYLDALAEIACMSRYHFARIFRHDTGVSPMSYVRQARVTAAKNLMATSKLPLRVIAPMVGFADEFQLCRVFKQVTGHSPRHAD